MIDLTDLTALHLLRPMWLLLIPIWLVLLWLLHRRHASDHGWASLCDPALLLHITGSRASQRLPRSIFVALAVAGTLALLALSGPVFKQLPQPVMQARVDLVIVLDLSASMLAEDAKPSRLQRAKQKIQDMLKLKKEGQTGLVVFAGSSFDVVPLTTDNNAIQALLPSLEPSMMPVQGSMASEGLQHADAMLKRVGAAQGSIILLTDGVDADAITLATKLASHRQISVLAIGSADGAPIPGNNGSFIHDAQGNIVLAQVDMPQLVALANAGGGVFRQVQIDDSDLLGLPGLQASALNGVMDNTATQTLQTDQWREEGPWLLWLALPLFALLFRRGLLLAIPLMLMLTLQPQHAAASIWQNLWQTPDQQGQALLAQQKPEQAAKTFENPDWKASAQYQAGQYDEAAETLKHQGSPDGLYNRGNALARSGKLQDAVAAYEQALKLKPQLPDAADNLALVKKLLEQQQQQQQNQQGDNNDSDASKDGEKNSSDSQQSGEHNKQGEQQDKQQSSSQEGEQNQSSGESQDSSQQQDSAQQNKQSSQADQGQQDGGDKSSAQTAQSKPDGEEADQKTDKQQTADKQSEEPANSDESAQALQQKPADGEQASQSEREVMQAQQQWLRRIPDDPGGLLRRKFRYQYQQQQAPASRGQPW